jgi:hypothetical protein
MAWACFLLRRRRSGVREVLAVPRHVARVRILNVQQEPIPGATQCGRAIVRRRAPAPQPPGSSLREQ